MYDYKEDVIKFALTETLAFLRALQMSHRQASWVAGDYSDQMMFERLTWGLDEEIKILAEKCITYFGAESINKHNQSKKIAEILSWVSHPNPVKEAEMLEDKFQSYLLSVYEMVVASKKMTMGLDDQLQSIANKHEQNLFQLRKRLKETKKASLSTRVARLHLQKRAFNKYNPTELLGQLFSVLNKAGLEDTVEQLKAKGFTKLIDKAWKERER